MRLQQKFQDFSVKLQQMYWAWTSQALEAKSSSSARSYTGRRQAGCSSVLHADSEPVRCRWALPAPQQTRLLRASSQSSWLSTQQPLSISRNPTAKLLITAYKSRKATVSPILWIPPNGWIFMQIPYQTDVKAALLPDSQLAVINNVSASLINCEYLNYLNSFKVGTKVPSQLICKWKDLHQTNSFRANLFRLRRKKQASS